MPQGMKNSVVLCQKFMAQDIQNIREQFPQAFIIHYMDNILLAHKDEVLVETTIYSYPCRVNYCSTESAKAPVFRVFKSHVTF